MDRCGLRVPHGLGPPPFPETSIRTGSGSFMIAKTFAPFLGVKPFAIMEISRLTARRAWPAARRLSLMDAVPARVDVTAGAEVHPLAQSRKASVSGVGVSSFSLDQFPQHPG
jgi:hypothetical protein